MKKKEKRKCGIYKFSRKKQNKKQNLYISVMTYTQLILLVFLFSYFELLCFLFIYLQYYNPVQNAQDLKLGRKHQRSSNEE